MLQSHPCSKTVYHGIKHWNHDCIKQREQFVSSCRMTGFVPKVGNGSRSKKYEHNQQVRTCEEGFGLNSGCWQPQNSGNDFAVRCKYQH